MIEHELEASIPQSEIAPENTPTPTVSRRTVIKGGIALAFSGGALQLLKKLTHNDQNDVNTYQDQELISQPEANPPAFPTEVNTPTIEKAEKPLNQDTSPELQNITEGLIPPAPPIPSESIPSQPDMLQQRLQEERLALLEEQDPVFENFLEHISQEAVVPPEQIPHRTMISKLGFNVLGGNNGDVILEDALLLNARSLLYVGSCEPFLKEFTDDKHRYLRKEKKISVITRYNCVDNIVSEEKHWSAFLHTLHIAKQYVGEEKGIDQLVEDGNLLVEIINEPNLYQQDVDPVIMANEFVEAGIVAKSNGFRVLIPPMAPHTPPEWAYGDEMEYYTKFLNAIKDHPHFDDIKGNLEISAHSYLRHPNDNPLPRLQEIDESVKNILGLDLPMHLTEFGLSRDFLSSASELEKTLAVRYLLSLPLSPHEYSKIKTMSWWTPFADAPVPNPEYEDLPIEDYRPQSLRAEDGSITPMYKTIVHTIVQRGKDIKRIHETETKKRSQIF